VAKQSATTAAAAVSAVKAAEKKKKKKRKRKANPPPVVETPSIQHLTQGRLSQKKKKTKPPRSHRSWRIDRRGGRRAPLPRGSGSWCIR
jgi:hypothetical protein